MYSIPEVFLWNNSDKDFRKVNGIELHIPFSVLYSATTEKRWWILESAFSYGNLFLKLYDCYRNAPEIDASFNDLIEDEPNFVKFHYGIHSKIYLYCDGVHGNNVSTYLAKN